ncbi:MAG: FixH family protein [Pseudomonadales bacterium]|nr:FixH family protein [Pseudomonadales bacterium]
MQLNLSRPLLLTLLYCGCLSSYSVNSIAQDRPLETETRAGNLLQVNSLLDPIEINRIHSWEMTLLTADNQPIQNATISVAGGMPDHDHGLPTLPQVTREISAGRYLIEGIRFHMPGRWEINFSIETDAGTDIATLDFSL